MDKGSTGDGETQYQKKHLSHRTQIILCVLVLTAIVGILSFPRMHGPIDLRYDASVYYILGTSLYQGKGYRLLNEPGEIEAVQYPPLLPALVAAHQFVIGTDDHLVVGEALRRTFIFFNLLVVLLAFAYARMRVRPWAAFVVGALTALNWEFCYLSDLLFTELPFTLVTLLFLITAELRRRWSLPVCAVLGWMAFLLRTSAVALFAAWVVEAGIKKEFRTAAVRALIAAVPILAWQMYVHRVQSSEAYGNPAYAYQRAPSQFYNVTYGENLGLTDPFRPELGEVTSLRLVQRVAANLIRLPLTLGEGALIPIMMFKWPFLHLERELGLDINNFIWGKVNRLLSFGPIVFGIPILIGGLLMLKDEDRLPALYAGAAIALICTTPWPDQNTRYLTPLIPILALALLNGLEATAEYLGRIFPVTRLPIRKFVILAVIIPILAIQTIDWFLTFDRHINETKILHPNGEAVEAKYFFFDARWKGLEGAIRWIADEADRGAIVATTNPHLLYLQTGNLSVMPPFEIDRERALQMLDSVPIDYVLIDALKHLDVARNYTQPVLESAPDLWRPVFEDVEGKVIIYGRASSAEPAEGESSLLGSNSNTRIEPRR